MEIIPAIDLKNGKCVRLLQGKDELTTEYSNEPVAVALEWVRQGAKRIHIVNLDGAFGRTSSNLQVVEKICKTVDTCIEFGGGLRSEADIQYAFDIGIDKIVLGTIAITNPPLLESVLARFRTDRVIVALDAVKGDVATHGWTRITKRNVVDVARDLKLQNVSEILYTDISKDGMLTGPDFPMLEQLASVGLRVIASGGVSSKEDVVALKKMNQPNIAGVIIGKSLYEGKIVLNELLAELDTSF